MLRNYIKIALRYIFHHKLNTVINVLGLALGICTCIVIYLISSYDLSFDVFHPDKERIYRVVSNERTISGEQIYFNNLPFTAQPTMQSELSGIDVVAGFYPYWAKIVTHNSDGTERKFDCATDDGNWWTSVIVASPNYFKIFKYDWLAGNEEVALNNPYSTVLSDSRARKYFGNIPLNQIMGREIIYNNTLSLRVSGIVKDWNKNTDFPFTDFISLNSFNNKDRYGLWTFIKLSKKVLPATINTQLNNFKNRFFKPNPTLKRSLILQPLSDMHFNFDYIEDRFRKAHLPTIYTLIAIGLFILIIAVVNFINLSTAQSIERAKEIGVRKVLGSGKVLLILQFLTETFVITFFAVCIALLMVKPVLLAFHDFIPNGIKFNPFHFSTLLFLLLLTMSTSLLAGIYPAIVLSSYLPVVSLKESGTQRGGEKWFLQKGLVVFQFTISFVLIIGAIVINSQLKFIRNKDMGYNANGIIILKTPFRDSLSKVKIMAEKIKQLPEVSLLALESFPPIGVAGDLFKLKYNGVEMMVAIDEGNEDFISLYQMKILAGRNLNHSDSLKELVLNESLSRVLGFSEPQDAIGKFVHSEGKAYPIIGVVADYHIKSLHEPITPVIIGHIPQEEKEIAIKLGSPDNQIGNLKTTLSHLKSFWKEVYPNQEFNFTFLDESIAQMYEKERRTATLVNIAMIIVIFISCIGLFALASFTITRRTKEIGIRKVLGASVSNLVVLLCKDFIFLVIISIIIASPIAWFFMHQWLQNFSYRINISWLIFAIAGMAGIIIALITVSFQSIDAATANPVKSLRAE